MSNRPVGVPRQEARGAQAALGIAGAAAALVADLDALAGAGEQHRVVAHDVAAADGGEADGRRVALAGDAFAAVHGAQSARSRPSAAASTSPICSAVPLGASTLWRWWASIDLDVVALVQCAGGLVQQLAAPR
jgi:hypothetical protein